MLDELQRAVKRYTDMANGESPYNTAIDGFTLLRSDHQRPPRPLIFRPALCAAVQGAKSAIFADRRLEYRAGQALLVSVEMPGIGTVLEASPEEPFLGIVVELDLAIMREVLREMPNGPSGDASSGHGVCVTEFSGPLADCALRMMRLLDTPEAIPILSPGIMREICYWILSSPQGADVVRMLIANSHEQNVIRAIHSLRAQFAETVRIEDLAAIARMSPTAFHRHFKAITSMTPLQYQKQLRLIEARRLMFSEAINAETAAFQVGYESPSQFNREYVRMFGVPPRRDISSLRLTAD